MATAKKATKKTSKPAPKTTKSAQATKPAVKKVVKKTAAKSVKPKKVLGNNSFKLVKEDVSFTNFKFTEQTVYWIVLFAYIFALSLWVLTIQLNIMNIINSIAASLV